MSVALAIAAAAAFAMCSTFSRCAEAQRSQTTQTTKQTDSKSQLNSALDDAIDAGDSAAVSRLLSRGADPNYVRPYQSGFTPLVKAVCSITPHLDIANLLLQNGANIDARDDYGETTLERVSVAGDLKSLAFLLGHGASTNIADKYGRTALTEAALNGYGDVVDQLIAHGADVNVRYPNGETPLMIACQYTNLDERARQMTNDRVVGSDGHSLPPIPKDLQTVEADYDRCIKALLDKGASPKVRSADGSTPLMCAAGAHDANDTDLCIDLIHRGIDVNTRDSFGRTALHYVVYYPNGDWRNHERTLAVLDVLLKNGARVNIRDEDGKTALRYADEFGIGNVKSKLKAAGGNY